MDAAASSPGPDAPLVLPHGDPATEDRALHHGAAVFDRGARGRMSLTGPKAAELLTGLVTNDVLGLTPGAGQYAALLTPKGKIIADVRIFARADTLAAAGTVNRLLVDSSARAADGLVGTIRKYVNPRVAPYRDERALLAVLGVYGPTALTVVAAATGLDADALGALSSYAHLEANADGAEILVARVPELLVDGYDLFVPAAAAAALLARIADAGAVSAGAGTWDVARIEAGRPEWGLDMDENTIPQEANFDELAAISYTKGCYTGQETVARLHFRGHVNRYLRHVHFAGDSPAPRGAQLLDESGKVVGEVRSGARSPRVGALALAMVRREVASGASLLARWDDGEAQATVASLPYMLETAT
jgi:folate-binding protein YgfZ